ncbi:MAG TPA: HupE/UreJ family protein [Vicinamibacterales bacterium]|nr:HupE/UreJ family protein [Vicinamibacterales bacterium]
MTAVGARRRSRAIGWQLAFVLMTAPAVSAHEIGKTQVTATFGNDGGYQIDVVVDPDTLLTKLQVYSGAPPVSAPSRVVRDQRITALSPVFTEHVAIQFDGRAVSPAVAYFPASAFSDLAQAPSIFRLTGRVPIGTGTFAFGDGLVLGSYALNVRVGDAQPRILWLEGGRVSDPISLAAAAPLTALAIARQYFVLGFTHIVPNGFDHILFVIGIFLLSARWRSLFAQVSAFTVAHSITLGLTMYGVVSLPARVVEPMIALSIAYVAIENLATSDLKPWRLALVFSFGLLHGMGFAGVLRDLGLPRSQFLTALLTFNGGVEAGQLTVIAAAFTAVAYWRAQSTVYRRLVVRPASLAIALIGIYWTIQRIV